MSLLLGLSDADPDRIAVAVLLAIVALSYRQTIFAYPSGGGSYVVSRENLGENPSLVAAGVPARRLHPHRRGVDLGRRRRDHLGAPSSARTTGWGSASALIAFITLANLRGIKESGTAFAAPTYLYIFSLGGARRLRALPVLHRRISTVPFDEEAFAGSAPTAGVVAGVILLSSCRLLVGCGGAHRGRGDQQRRARVPAPGGQERGEDAGGMVVILGTLFFGISVLAHQLGPPSRTTRRSCP